MDPRATCDVSTPAPLSADDEVRFRALLGEGPEASKVYAFMSLLPARMQPAYARDALARHAFARGTLPHHMAGSPTAGMVRLRDVHSYGGIIPDDDTHRIQVVPPGERAPLRGPAVSAPSADFVRYCNDVCCAGPGHRSPLADIVAGTPGTFIAGGTPASEALLPESRRRLVTLRFADESAREYQLKGSSDVDNFITLQTLSGTAPGTSAAMDTGGKRRAAQGVAMAAVAAADWQRYALPCPTCTLCTEPLEQDGMYSVCSKGVHAFHSDCYDAWRKVNYDDDEQTSRRPCAVKGCLYHLNIHDKPVASACSCTSTRCTVNIHEPWLDGMPRTPVLWQLTTRVYDDWRQIMAGFDLAPSQVGFDGQDMWVTEMAAVAIANGVIPVTPFLMSSTCELRVYKYAERYGFELYNPCMTRAQYTSLRPDTVRGVAGLKWLAARVADERGDQGAAWRVFVNEVRCKSRAATRFLDLCGVDASLELQLLWEPPYVQGRSVESMHDDDDAATATTLPGKRKGKTWKGRYMHVGRCDGPWGIAELLTYQVVNPGSQSFHHANHARNGRQGLINATCLWHAPPLAMSIA